MNGMNGANAPGAVGGMIPNQAGHQAELSYIYGMVEELSRQLAENKQALEKVVTGVGRVRNRARTHALGNEELIASAADEIKEQDPNMDMLVSALSEAIDKAKYSRDANAALLAQYASALTGMLRQLHEYKARHVADVAAWHRSYRAQLAEARAENSRLREQIWDMHARAGKANEMLRDFRARFDDEGEEDEDEDEEGNKDAGKRKPDAKEAGGDEKKEQEEPSAEKKKKATTAAAAKRRREARVRAKALRQELRFWKRMAMPEIPDDDPCWSDDDDLVDPIEKERLRELEKKNAESRQLLAAAAASESSESSGESGGEEGDGPIPGVPLESIQEQPGSVGIPQGVMGGVPMQREESGGFGGMPAPPPRPPSASSTGSSGQ